jgi:hypothetical protein
MRLAIGAILKGKTALAFILHLCLFQFLRPRALRWLLRTEALKKHPISADGPQGLQFAVKRVVSESELNSLLKNAWLGRK